MARRPLARATAWIAASILAVGCGGNDSGVAGSAGGSEDVAADSDSGEDFDRDESAATMFRQLSFKQAHDAYCECGVYQRQFPKVDWSDWCGE